MPRAPSHASCTSTVAKQLLGRPNTVRFELATRHCRLWVKFASQGETPRVAVRGRFVHQLLELVSLSHRVGCGFTELDLWRLHRVNCRITFRSMDCRAARIRRSKGAKLWWHLTFGSHNNTRTLFYPRVQGGLACNGFDK
jgi:hypothetical protein